MVESRRVPRIYNHNDFPVGSVSCADDRTFRELRALCRIYGKTQHGKNKEELKNSLGSEALKGPVVWFWYDEVLGMGPHKPVYLCRCGASMVLNRFNIQASSGWVLPSIICGNCSYHIWAQFMDFDDEPFLGKGEFHDYYYDRFKGRRLNGHYGDVD